MTVEVTPNSFSIVIVVSPRPVMVPTAPNPEGPNSPGPPGQTGRGEPRGVNGVAFLGELDGFAAGAAARLADPVGAPWLEAAEAIP